MTRGQVMNKKALQAKATSQMKTTRWFSFIGDVKAELKKITWTTKDELLTYTRIVVIATLCLGVGIFVIDLVVRGCLVGMDSLLKMITG